MQRNNSTSKMYKEGFGKAIANVDIFSILFIVVVVFGFLMWFAMIFVEYLTWIKSRRLKSAQPVCPAGGAPEDTMSCPGTELLYPGQAPRDQTLSAPA